MAEFESNEAIYVTRAFLPPIIEYNEKVETIYKSGFLTNNGPLLDEFESKMKAFLNVDYFHFLANGTLALQLALSGLEIDDGEIITTPFSYVATTSSILWQRCKPIFVDIELNNFTIDADKIEEAITPDTKAIMAVHVFGYACNIEKIQSIADKYNLKVIYDAAHTFGVKYKGRSISSYGDASILSFHSTKLFHTVEGGACIVKDSKVSDKINLQKRFGHKGDEHICLGINAKQSEFHAAMGLANFPYIREIIAERKKISRVYDENLPKNLTKPNLSNDIDYNYAYYPVLFESERQLIEVFEELGKNNIFPRRYFYPSLNQLPYTKYQSCPISEDISTRIACLPLYGGLSKENVINISKLIGKVLNA